MRDEKPVFTELNDYNGFGKCLRISNRELEVVVTLDIGPRVIRFSFPDRENVFEENPPVSEAVDGDVWKIHGGHRVWHSPEAYPRSYVPDNGPLEKHDPLENGIVLYQKEEPWVQVQKAIEVRLADSHVELTNTLINGGAWPIEMSVWSLTVGAKGGREVVPMVQRNTGLLANRHVVMWPDSTMNDPRVYWGQKYIVVDNDVSAEGVFKFGYPNEYGWACYFNHGSCFVKKFRHQRDGRYPDFGCSWETYTANWGIELECLSPLAVVEPGAAISLQEQWYLIDNVARPEIDEASIDRALAPVAERAGIHIPVLEYDGWKNVANE
jgi:hypothetical protein